MERFYDNDPDKERKPFFGSNYNGGNDDDDDNDDFDDDEEGIPFIDQQGMFDIMQMELARSELNQQLVSKAIDLAKQSWFWRFKSSKAKLQEIQMIYKEFVILCNTKENKTEEK